MSHSIYSGIKQARPVTYSMFSLDTLIIVCYDKGKTKTVSGWLALFLYKRGQDISWSHLQLAAQPCFPH